MGLLSLVVARRRSCQARFRSTGIRSPSAVTPSTSISAEPIMKSMCWALSLGRSRSSVSQNAAIREPVHANADLDGALRGRSNWSRLGHYH